MGEHAQVVVGVGGGKEDFIDLCRTGAVAIPSGYDVAFLIWAGGDGGVTFGDFKSVLRLLHGAFAPSDLINEFHDFSVVHFRSV